MSVASPGSAARAVSRKSGALTAAAERLIDTTPEAALVASILVGFVVLWMIFWAVSTAPLDAHVDAGEAAVWAQHFAFGYKHPPMTGWIFMLWFSVFPHQRWASDLLIVTSNAVALAITWRLLRDHLDKNRALLGLIALILIPLYTVKAEVLNANTVTMPLWAATTLFYLRARRSLTVTDALLAGIFAGIALLGKYWSVFLLAGLAVAALSGPGFRRFWRSSVPYLMVVAALVVVAPHLWWTFNHREALQFAASIVDRAPYGETLWKTVFYLVGTVLYAIVPLIFFVALKPSAATLRDTVWPADEIRRQAFIVLIVALVLPAVVNLIVPYRLTPDWTFPDWAPLPLVLYGSPLLAIDTRATARGGVIGLALVLAIVAASPAIAYIRLKGSHDRDRRFAAQIAQTAKSLTDQPITSIRGTADMIAGLPFYLPQARTFVAPDGEGAALIVCTSADAACEDDAAAQVKEGARTTTAIFKRSFLGFDSSPETFQITVIPARAPR